MTRNILITLLLSLSYLAFTQAKVSTEFETSIGSPYKVIDAKEKYYFSKGSEILTLKIDGRDAKIQKLNSKTLNFIQVQDFEDFMPKGGILETVIDFNDKIFLLYSLWDKPNEQLFAKEIDFAKGAFTGSDKLILKTDKKISYGSGFFFGIGGYGYGAYGTTGKFSFNLSFDNKKLLVQYRLKPEIKNDDNSYDIIGMNVYSGNMSKDWAKEVTMPYTEKKMNNLDYTLDSEGNVYMLTTVYEDNTTKLERDGKANFHMEILKVKTNTGQIKSTKVDMEGKYINELWLKENKSGQIIGAGYYSSNVRQLDDADGVFMFKLDKEGMIKDKKMYEIPVSVLNKYLTERQQKKNEKRDEDDKATFTDLELRNLIVQEDGSIVIIGEQYFYITRTYTTQNGTTTRTTYYYNDMLVTKINPDGKLAWMQKLGKRQSGAAGQGGMSFKYMQKNGSHYLLFLDNVKNLELPSNEVPKRHIDGMGGFMTAYKLDDKSGDISKLSLFDLRDVKGTEVFQFNTERILSTSDSEFVVEVYKKKKEDILIKVVLK